MPFFYERDLTPVNTDQMKLGWDVPSESNVLPERNVSNRKKCTDILSSLRTIVPKFQNIEKTKKKSFDRTECSFNLSCPDQYPELVK